MSADERRPTDQFTSSDLHQLAASGLWLTNHQGDTPGDNDKYVLRRVALMKDLGVGRVFDGTRDFRQTLQMPIRDAVKTLYETQVSSLLVVADDRVVGIFTERDVLEKVAGDYPALADKPVQEVMTADPTVVYETDPVGAAVAAIAVAGHRHVPVLKMDSTLYGIVSPRRVIQYLEKHFGSLE